jgi:hypothetical protein
MAEEAVIALIAKHFTYQNVPEKVKDYFNEMDDGYLFGESNFDEFDLEKLEKGKILIGKDVLAHPKIENIKKFLCLLRDFGGFEIEGVDLPVFFEPSDPILAEIVEVEKEYEIEFDEIDELDAFDGSVVYCCNDRFVVKDDEVLASQQFVIANKIKSLSVEIEGEVKKLHKLKDLKGTFGIILKDTGDYPFKRVKIRSL